MAQTQLHRQLCGEVWDGALNSGVETPKAVRCGDRMVSKHLETLGAC